MNAQLLPKDEQLEGIIKTKRKEFVELEIGFSFLASDAIVEPRIEEEFCFQEFVDGEIEGVFPFNFRIVVVCIIINTAIPRDILEHIPIVRDRDIATDVKMAMLAWPPTARCCQVFAVHVRQVACEGGQRGVDVEFLLAQFVVHTDGEQALKGRHEIRIDFGVVFPVTGIKLCPRLEGQGVVPMFRGLVANLVGHTNEVGIGAELVLLVTLGGLEA